MSIIRAVKDKDNPYLIINKEPIIDPGLSAKAKGIHSYIMTLPDDWKIYVSELIKHFTDGRDSIKAGLRELEKTGYILKIRIKSSTGKFDGWDYKVFEKKGLAENPQPKTEFPKTEKPKTEKPQLLNNYNTKYTKNKLIIYGQHKNVKLKENELDQLIAEFGETTILKKIEDLSWYMKSKGKSYKNHNMTIRNWIRKDGAGTMDPAVDPYIEKLNSLK